MANSKFNKHENNCYINACPYPVTQGTFDTIRAISEKQKYMCYVIFHFSNQFIPYEYMANFLVEKGFDSEDFIMMGHVDVGYVFQIEFTSAHSKKKFLALSAVILLEEYGYIINPKSKLLYGYVDSVAAICPGPYIHEELSKYGELIGLDRKLVDYGTIKIPCDKWDFILDVAYDFDINSIPFKTRICDTQYSARINIDGSRACILCNKRGHFKNWCENIFCKKCKLYHKKDEKCEELTFSKVVASPPALSGVGDGSLDRVLEDVNPEVFHRERRAKLAKRLDVMKHKNGEIEANSNRRQKFITTSATYNSTSKSQHKCDDPFTENLAVTYSENGGNLNCEFPFPSLKDLATAVIKQNNLVCDKNFPEYIEEGERIHIVELEEGEYESEEDCTFPSQHAAMKSLNNNFENNKEKSPFPYYNANSQKTPASSRTATQILNDKVSMSQNRRSHRLAKKTDKKELKKSSFNKQSAKSITLNQEPSTSASDFKVVKTRKKTLTSASTYNAMDDFSSSAERKLHIKKTLRNLSSLSGECEAEMENLDQKVLNSLCDANIIEKVYPINMQNEKCGGESSSENKVQDEHSKVPSEKSKKSGKNMQTAFYKARIIKLENI